MSTVFFVLSNLFYVELDRPIFRIVKVIRPTNISKKRSAIFSKLKLFFFLYYFLVPTSAVWPQMPGEAELYGRSERSGHLLTFTSTYTKQPLTERVARRSRVYILEVLLKPLLQSCS